MSDKLISPSPYVDKPLPDLAESATQVDPSTWIVKLRDGVNLSVGNGEAVGLVILHQGQVVEEGAADVIERPKHPYTARLVAAAVTLPNDVHAPD